MTQHARTRFAIIFDDGFEQSTLATAELFEPYKLPAVFAVLANPGGFAPEHRVGDFDLWNELRGRGHVIQPHGFTHANLTELPHGDAVRELERCFATFDERLDGFEAARSVYCFAYNAATRGLIDWLLPRVAAVRTGGSGFLTDADLTRRVWPSTTFGPGDPSEDLLRCLSDCRGLRPPAFVYCLHGLDGLAWGAIARDALRRVLDQLVDDPSLEYWAVA